MSVSTRKVEILKIENLAKVFEGLDARTVRSVVAIKEGSEPLVHLVAISHEIAGKIQKALDLLDVKISYVEVVTGDFGDMESSIQ